MSYVNAENSTYSASVITAAIHGFRIENNTLEGIIVRDLQTNKTDTNTNNCPDNGTWDFRYCLTTFDPTNQTAAINQQRLAYQFNFRMFTYQGTSIMDTFTSRNIVLYRQFARGDNPRFTERLLDQQFLFSSGKFQLIVALFLILQVIGMGLAMRLWPIF